jgi:hypothetical protein
VKTGIGEVMVLPQALYKPPSRGPDDFNTR